MKHLFLLILCLNGINAVDNTSQQQTSKPYSPAIKDAINSRLTRNQQNLQEHFHQRAAQQQQTQKKIIKKEFIPPMSIRFGN